MKRVLTSFVVAAGLATGPLAATATAAPAATSPTHSATTTARTTSTATARTTSTTTARTTSTATARTTSTPARAAVDSSRRVADLDGDGRADTLTLTTVSARKGVVTYRLAVRTRRGTTSLLVRNDYYEGPVPARRVLRGTAPVDGVRGNEVLLDVSPDVGDAQTSVVYTMRAGRLTVLRSPNGSARRPAWDCFGPFLGLAHGYTFATVKGTRYVTYHALRRGGAGYAGPSTTYRWTPQGWRRTAIRNVSVPESQGGAYANWHGITWR